MISIQEAQNIMDTLNRVLLSSETGFMSHFRSYFCEFVYFGHIFDIKKNDNIKKKLYFS